MRHLSKIFLALLISSGLFQAQAEVTDYDCVFPSGINVFVNTGVVSIGDCNTDIYDNPDINVATGNISTSCSTPQHCDGNECNATNQYALYLTLPDFPNTLNNHANKTQTISSATDTIDDTRLALTIDGDFDYTISNSIRSDYYSITTQNGADVYFEYDTNYDPYVITELYLYSNNQHTITFEPGEYYIENFYHSAGTNIAVDGVGDGSGTVKIYVENSFTINAGTTYVNYNQALPAADQNSSKLLMVSYDGGITVQAGTNLAGYLYTPNGNIWIGAGTTNITGGLTAQNITFQDGLQFYYPDSDNRLGDNVCGGDGIINPAEHTALVDVLDGYTAPYNPWITTKVSNKGGYSIDAVYLGTGESASGLPQAYNTSAPNPNQSASITVLLKLADFSAPGTTCQTATPINLFTTVGGNTPVVAVIDAGETSDTTNSFVMAYAPDGATPLAKRDVRFMYKSIDFNQLIIDSGITCAQKSSTGGVVEGIPACLIANPNETSDQRNTAIDNYIKIFGSSAYQNCYTENGQPCWASNGGIGAPPYDHEYGCFECSIGDFPYVCSQDNFAIRPEQFNLTSTDPHHPDLLRSAADYNLTVHAYDYGTTNDSQDYNQTGGAGGNLTLAEDKILTDGSSGAALMNGTLAWSTWDFNITDGLSTRYDTASNEVAGVQFDDVGKVVLKVQDQEWADVDISNANDPTPHDCSADGAYICGENNVTYIPHHFAFSDVNITNNNGHPGTFTYLYNLDPADNSTFDMAARIQVTVYAKNEDNVTTENFTTGTLFYENPVSMTSAVYDSAHGDANSTLISPALLGFADGEKTIVWNETNISRVLRFNFQRAINNAVNPFNVTAPDVNITAESLYTQTPVAGHDTDATIDGNSEGIGDGNVTFYYGRLHAPRYRMETNTGAITLYYEVYCSPGADSNGNTCDVRDHSTVMTNRLLSVDDISWYRNVEHNSSYGWIDTTVAGGGITERSNITGNPVTESFQSYSAPVEVWLMQYDGSKGYPFKATMQMSTQDWLLYHRYNPSALTNDFELEFNSAGAWVGKETGNIAVDSNASINTNRRIEW